MSGIDREKLARLFEESLERPHDERVAFAHREAGDDPRLLAELLALLEEDRRFSEAGTEDIAVPLARVARAAQASDAEPAPLPEAIGPFRIVRMLGRGGMADVYLAEQSEPLKRRVALKLLRPGLDSHEVLARFEAERQALAYLDHPNIARAYDAGLTDEGRPYFVMEAIEGLSISRYADEQRLDLRARIELFLEVCEGLDHAHRKGLIHRDIKPSNVLVASEEGRTRVKIIDFGIAKSIGIDLVDDPAETRAGSLLGTPTYMSPEQASLGGREVDTRSDVYSLGVLLYELLAGVLPFGDAAGDISPMELRERILRDEAPTPSSRITSLGARGTVIAARRRSDPRRLRRGLRGELDWILAKILSKKPERRYGSAHELAADLRRHLAGEPVEAGPPSLSYRVGKLVRRHKVSAGLLAALLVALVSSVAALAYVAQVENRERAIAEAESRKAQRVLELFQGVLISASERNEESEPVTVVDALEAASERVADVLDDEPLVKAAILVAIARGLERLQEYESAEEILWSAMQLLEGSTLDTQDPALVDTRHDVQRVLGRVLLWRGELEEAEPFLRKAADHEASTPLERAQDLNTLALLLRRTKRLEEARVIFERAQTLAQEHASDFDFDEHHVARALGLTSTTPEETSSTISENLAQILYLEGDIEGAEERVRETLAFRAQGEPGNAGVAVSTFNLAWLIRAQGRYEDARPLLAEAVRLERELGRRGQLARALQVLGSVERELGMHESAIERVTEAVSLQRDVQGPSHAGVFFYRGELARALVAAGKAEEGLREADAMIRDAKRLAPSSPRHERHGQLARALALEDLGRRDEAREATRRAEALEEAARETTATQ